MAYTKQTWATGDTITAQKLNHIEDGIESAGGSGYDAVIRLTHANNSGFDTAENLTVTIVSGGFSAMYAKWSNGDVPNILVQYLHPNGNRWTSNMVQSMSPSDDTFLVDIFGPFYLSSNTHPVSVVRSLVIPSDSDPFFD